MSADFAPSSETPETGPGSTPPGGGLWDILGTTGTFSGIDELTKCQLRRRSTRTDLKLKGG
jgi:hypothetical protein